jgi:sarcosine oxidase
LPVESLSASERHRRYPQFKFGDDYHGVLERSAGFLYVDDCVRTLLDEAARLGATLCAGEPVMEWTAGAGAIEVRTPRRRATAARLIITAGPWALRLLEKCGWPLTIMRQVPMWFEPHEPSRFRRDVFPIYIAETSLGYFYGLPAIDPSGAKVAEHYGAPELADVADIRREIAAADEERVRCFLRMHLPALDGPCRRASVCIYTLTPDRHFIIDTLPDNPGVAVACGFSGHGFKFAPAVAEVLADLAESGRTQLPVAMLRANRFARSSVSGPMQRGSTQAPVC